MQKDVIVFVPPGIDIKVITTEEPVFNLLRSPKPSEMFGQNKWNCIIWRLHDTAA